MTWKKNGALWARARQAGSPGAGGRMVGPIAHVLPRLMLLGHFKADFNEINLTARCAVTRPQPPSTGHANCPAEGPAARPSHCNRPSGHPPFRASTSTVPGPTQPQLHAGTGGRGMCRWEARRRQNIEPTQ